MGVPKNVVKSGQPSPTLSVEPLSENGGGEKKAESRIQLMVLLILDTAFFSFAKRLRQEKVAQILRGLA